MASASKRRKAGFMRATGDADNMPWDRKIPSLETPGSGRPCRLLEDAGEFVRSQLAPLAFFEIIGHF